MPAIVDAFRRAIVGVLFSASDDASGGIADAVANGAYRVDLDATGKSLRLGFGAPDRAAEPFASDFGRFARASFQAAHSASICAEDVIGAPIAAISAYYAAFYASSAIARCFGRACVWLPRSSVDVLARSADAYSVEIPFALDQAQYEIVLDGDSLRIESPRKNSLQHENQWRHFCRTLRGAASSIIKLNADRDVDIAAADFIESIIVSVEGDDSNRSLLSAFRNDIQYRHGRGLWFPSRLRKREIDAFRRGAVSWRSPLESWVATVDCSSIGLVRDCSRVIAMCREIAWLLCRRPGARAGWRADTLRLLRELRVAEAG